MSIVVLIQEPVAGVIISVIYLLVSLILLFAFIISRRRRKKEWLPWARNAATRGIDARQSQDE